jgi:hypothetical protein
MVWPLAGHGNPVTIIDTADSPLGTATNPFKTTATAPTSTTFTPTQVTVPATANGILVLAANASRLGATITNPGTVTVYLGSAATGLTTGNGFALLGGSSYNIDTPLYTGAIYGIIATSTQVVTVVELT